MNIPDHPLLLQMPADIRYLPPLLGLVREIAVPVGFEERDILKIEIAVEEAVSNIIKHGYQGNPDAVFDLIFQPMTIGLEIILRDMGRPMNPSDIKSYDREHIAETQDPRGLGSFLIRSVMDVVEYKNLGNKGKQLRMVRYLPGAEKQKEEKEAPVQPDESAHSALPVADFAIESRRLLPEDAYHVAELAYDVYGYSYLYEHIYYPERIIALNKTDELVSCVAIANGTELAGHVALVCDKELPGLAELGLAMVKPEYRGAKLLDKLTTLCTAELHRLGINALFAQATTIHTYSQPAAKKIGMKPVCFILGYISPMKLRNIEESGKERVTPVVAMKTGKPWNAGTLYIPAKHRDMVAALLRNIEVTWEPGSSPGIIKPQSVYTIQINPVSQLQRMIVFESGQNLVHELKMSVIRMKHENLLVGELLLNLNEPMNETLFADIEELGFIFTGILPACNKGNFLTMVYLNGIDIEFDHIRLIEDFGQDLLAYIRHDYEKRFLE